MIEGVISDIKLLAQERPLVTDEVFKFNDLYGHAYVLKKYAQLKQHYQIKGVLEHAAMLFDHVWPNDLAVPLPAHFVFSSHRFPFLRQLTNKALFAIGPSIHYAEPIFSEKELKEIKEALGKTLLVFLPHSSQSLIFKYDYEEIFSHLRKFEKEFDNILICVAWRDILLDFEKPFISCGYTCVTAGHIHDINFLSRLKTLILLSSHTMSFNFGSHIGFCVYLNKPHFVVPLKKTSVEGPEEIKKTATYKGGPLGAGQSEYFLNFFKEPLEDITPKQMELVDFYWGLSDIKKPEELREIFYITEDMFKNRFYPSNKRDPIFFCQFLDYLAEKKIEKARSLLNWLQKLNYYPGWTYLFNSLILMYEKNLIEFEKNVDCLRRYGGFFREKADSLLKIGNIDDHIKELQECLYKMYPRATYYENRKMVLPWKREAI